MLVPVPLICLGKIAVNQEEPFWFNFTAFGKVQSVLKFLKDCLPDQITVMEYLLAFPNWYQTCVCPMLTTVFRWTGGWCWGKDAGKAKQLKS